MRGLLLKDYYCMKESMKSLFFALIVYGVIFLPRRDGGISMITIGAVVGSTLVRTIFSYDKQAGFDTYALSMPLSRWEIVAEKFIFAISQILIWTVISTVIVSCNLLLRQIYIENVFLEILGTGIAGLTVAGIYLAVSMPLTIWLGVEKARLLPSALMIILFVGIVLLATMGGNINIPDSIFLLGIAMAFVISLITLAVSYVISVKLYEKRDF